MRLEHLDLSPLAALAWRCGLACQLIVLAPLAWLMLLGGPLADDLLPGAPLARHATLAVYTLLAWAVWRGWGPGGLGRQAVAAIAAFVLFNAGMLVHSLGQGQHGPASTFGWTLAAAVGTLALVGQGAWQVGRAGLHLPARWFATLFLRRGLQRPPRRRSGAGSLWLYAEGLASLLAGAGWLHLLGSRLEGEGPFRSTVPEPVLALLEFGLTMPLFFHALNCQRKATQRRALSIEEARAVDPRAPVLYLRAFADDNLHVPANHLLLAARLPLECPAIDPVFWGRRVRLEEVLASALWATGPVVAIGAPQETLPPLGALRSYYDDSHWQAEVVGLMQRARLVVVLASPSPWVRWEMQTLHRLGLGDKTVLLLPPVDSSLQQAAWDAALPCLAPDDASAPAPMAPAMPTDARALVLRDRLCVSVHDPDFGAWSLALLARCAAQLALRQP